MFAIVYVATQQRKCMNYVHDTYENQWLDCSRMGILNDRDPCASKMWVKNQYVCYDFDIAAS